ncbi:MAG: ATP-binding protein [Verrucomicrobiota bacterium]
MRSLRNLSIKRKLMFLMMLTSSLALLLASSAFIAYEWFTFRKVMVRDLTTQAEIIAANSSAALLFDDPVNARETLMSLQAKSHVLSACIFSLDGRILAEYSRDDRQETPTFLDVAATRHRFHKSSVSLYLPVNLKGERLGLVYLKSDFQPIYNRLVQYLEITILVLVVSSLAAFSLSSLLQRIISEPILKLARVTREVSTNKNYSIRAEKESQDELGTLMDGFNDMLAQIQSREIALQSAHDKLEQRVTERTRELQQEVFERKRAETALADEKELLAVALRSIGDAVIATDKAGRIILFNAVAEKLTGWNYVDALGEPVESVFSIRLENQPEPASVLQVLDSEQSVELPPNAILVGLDGSERLVAGNASPLRNKDGKVIGVALAFRDITEQQKMATELLKASKLESLGVLAGGIAHDFNNILGSILGNLSLAKMLVAAETELYTTLERAVKASLRAKELTRQLLTFAKGGAPVRKAASIADLIRDTTHFVLRGSNVRSELLLPDDLWPAEIDEGQIGQVLDNLIINARQAMPDGGVVKLKAENLVLPENSRIPLSTGRYIHLSIHDTGIGIAPENLPKIFDPYFTTKQKGSGLGLATTYSIMRKHEGHISVESAPGEGTTFHLYLPASSKPLPEKPAEKLGTLGGQGRVLVMDDEPSIRQLLQAMLKMLGYEVETVTDGAEAIQVYCVAQATGKPFNVVIMDLTIPGGMGGKEAIQKLTILDPEVRAIVSSGYSNDPVMANFKEYGFRGMVAKPYQIEDLARALKEVITARE